VAKGSALHGYAQSSYSRHGTERRKGVRSNTRTGCNDREVHTITAHSMLVLRRKNIKG